MPPAKGRDPALPVSVVIPAYNRADLLPRAIASVLAQSRLPAETIVVDDASIDDTAAVAAALGATFIRHDHNQGEGASRNSGIQAAAQPWVALLDSDDEWMPQHLEHVFGLRDNHVLIAAATLRVGQDPDAERIYGTVGKRPTVLDSPASVAYPVNRAPASSVMLLRQAVLDAGGFDTSLRLCADLDMSIRILERGTGIASPVIGSIYHVHGGQASRNSREMHQAYREVLARYRGRPWCTPSLLKRSDGVIEWDSLRRALRDRQGLDATRSLVRILAHPQRARGVARILGLRMWMRRRVARLDI